MLDIIDIHDISSNTDNNNTNGSSGVSLYNLIKKCLENNIPLNNLISFGANDAANIMGRHNFITCRLRENLPGIVKIKCVYHSIHLCASEAAKTLPRATEDLLRIF